MIAVQYTVIGNDWRESFRVIGQDRQDVCKTALELSRHHETPRAIIAQPIHFTEAEPA